MKLIPLIRLSKHTLKTHTNDIKKQIKTTITSGSTAPIPIPIPTDEYFRSSSISKLAMSSSPSSNETSNEVPTKKLVKKPVPGRSGIRLDWIRRLKIVVGAARELQYLHDLADPPIIHRDIKTNNILLDQRLVAKVFDFGLSKPMNDANRAHITTQVKGTLGYMDPEYYMTQQLTEKSDAYSFGVVMLELITARNPIDNGRSTELRYEIS